MRVAVRAQALEIERVVAVRLGVRLDVIAFEQALVEEALAEAVEQAAAKRVGALPPLAGGHEQLPVVGGHVRGET